MSVTAAPVTCTRSAAAMHGLLVRAGLDHDRGPRGELWIDDDGIASAAHGRHRAELELRVVAAEILLRGQVHVVSTAAVELAHLSDVDSRRRRQHGPQVSLRELDDKSLRDVVG